MTPAPRWSLQLTQNKNGLQIALGGAVDEDAARFMRARLVKTAAARPQDTVVHLGSIETLCGDALTLLMSLRAFVERHGRSFTLSHRAA